MNLLTTKAFEFFVPLEICKSDSQKQEQGHKRVIQGVASTEAKDLQNEIVYKKGIDFSYFLEYGYYNNDHKPGFENKVGQPTTAQITAEGLWTKGFLFENHKVADAIWELAHALEASNSERKLGFSIQGKVIQRASNKILKCWVQDIAITAAPINTHTWLEIVKSLNAIPAEMWCSTESGLLYPDDTVKAFPCTCGGRCSKSCKAFSEDDIDLRKDDDEGDEKKALEAGAGSPIVPESLEEDLTDLRWGDVKTQTKKSMEFAECVSLLQKVRGFDYSEANELTKAIFSMNGLI